VAVKTSSQWLAMETAMLPGVGAPLLVVRVVVRVWVVPTCQ